MANTFFLFDIVFDTNENPPRTCDRFSESLKVFLASHQFDIRLSGMGGMGRCRGYAYPMNGDVALDGIHQALENWIRAQRAKCTARFGNWEEHHDQVEYFREVTERVFEVDNLMDEDRAEAAAWHEKVRQRMLQAGFKLG